VSIDEILQANGGIQLDIACGANKQPGYVGLDVQPLPGVDIIHDLNVKPWPLPDECVLRAIASHIVEHIPPVAVTETGTRFLFIEFMNEVWRVMKPGGELAIACPHGASSGFLQDPTHCNPINETTWAYFDMDHPFYGFYKPKPWRVKFINWNPAMNIEVVLIKERMEDVPDAS